ncbi:hypothetical protein F7725_003410 [Dissostichus mawsoni]|uniref:Uncharacterized protein n=1 Tax=Dissostichus mawsoni TaxID=36200 RepID=A0A7J5YA59_DISMA|nr:hypothetical protein F7725_003410 [Dissostichus mawsoni]
MTCQKHPETEDWNTALTEGHSQTVEVLSHMEQMWDSRIQDGRLNEKGFFSFSCITLKHVLNDDVFFWHLFAFLECKLSCVVFILNVVLQFIISLCYYIENVFFFSNKLN